MQYNFEWDPDKNKKNQKKHGIAFDQAATVFLDPRMLSLYDQEHSSREDRWITLGLSTTGGILVVHHTFSELDANNVNVRIFSCRKATKKEIKQYSE